MNTSTKITLSVVLLIIFIIVFVRWSDKKMPPLRPDIGLKDVSNGDIYNDRHIEAFLPAKPLGVGATGGISIPPELKGVTDDPNVAAFYQNHDPQKNEVGEVKITPIQSQQLYIGTKVVFEAAQILKRRSLSKDGTLALAAVFKPKPDVAGSSDDEQTLSEVWIVAPDGAKTRISPPQVKAYMPLISPNGKYVAFTANVTSSDGTENPPMLFVFDTTTRQIRRFGPTQKFDSYTVSAVEWTAGNELLVLEDHGETGGHMVMKSVHL